MENILSLSEAASACPSLGGKKPHLASIWRWCRKGIVRNATTVTLRYIRIGRRIGIPKDALDEFFVALAAADAAEPSPLERKAACHIVDTSRSEKRRLADIARSKNRLEKVGI